MARIKYVINERRVAYEGAINILKKRREDELSVTEAKKLEEERRAAKIKAKKLLEQAKKEKQEKALQRAIEEDTPKPRGEETKSEQFVVSGLFDTAMGSVTQKSSDKSKRP
jgi:hypothetical protein